MAVPPVKSCSKIMRTFRMSALTYIALVLSVLLASSSVASAFIVKRQAVQSPINNCGANGNADTICFPTKNSTLYNNTYYLFEWNPKYPTYAAQSELDIILYNYIDFQYKLIKNWTATSTDGQFSVLTDDSFYAVPLSAGSANMTLTYCLYIVGDGVDPAIEMKNPNSKYPSPVYFNFTESAYPAPPNTTSTILAALPTSIIPSATPNPNLNAQASSNAANKIQPWTIAVIAAASVAFLVACIAAILAIRANHKGKYDKKVYMAEPAIVPPKDRSGPGAGLFDSRDISSIHSTTPIIQGHRRTPTNEGNISIFSANTGKGTVRQNSGGPSIYSPSSPSLSPSNSPQQLHTQLHTQSTEQIIPQINEPRTSTSLLTSNDAIMLADTFRQLMRKPDWQEQEELNDLSSPSATNEEEERRRLGDALLRKELAEEGTPMQRVQRKATQFHVIDEKQAVVGEEV